MSVLAPSDLNKSRREDSFSLAGRILQIDQGRLVLCDAYESVSVETGELQVPSAGSFVELLVSWDGVRARCHEVLAVYPAPEPDQNGEFLPRRMADRGRALRARSFALRTIHEYFHEQGFIEVETPSLGVCPGLDPHVHSLGSVRGPSVPKPSVAGSTDASVPRFLMTSPEFFMKRLLTAGHPRLFQVTRSFRSEEMGALHEPEFSLLEWYRAFESWDSVMDDTERLIRLVFQALRSHAARPPELPSGPFPRLTVREAFQRFAQIEDASRIAEENPDIYFRTLVDRVEPGLQLLGGPLFLTEFPRSQAALARLSPSDPTVAERFELLIDGVEVCNGYGELTDEPLQRARFLREQERRREACEPVYPLDERFLSALCEGMPPAAGNALGIDRLVLLALGKSELREVIAFGADEA